MSLSLYIYFVGLLQAHNNICAVTNLDVWWASVQILYQECDSLLHFVVTVGISLNSSCLPLVF